MLTAEEARKILGADSANISDADIQKDIDTAELLKNIFFSMLRKKKN